MSNTTRLPSGWQLSVHEDENEFWLRIVSPDANAAAFAAKRGSIRAQVLQELAGGLATESDVVTRLRADLQLAAETLRKNEAFLRGLADSCTGAPRAAAIGGADRDASLAARFEQTLKETE